MEYQAAVKKVCSISPRRVVMFIGSGMVLDLGYPTWRGLLDRMVPFVESRFAPLAEVMRYRLGTGDLVASADPAFEKEISALDRAHFFKEVFDARPELKRRHRLLGNLPVAAFATTNFDETIELAIQLHKEQRDPRRAIVFSGVDRFRRFNSELPLYRDSYHSVSKQKALVVKVHNDVNDVENIVLSSASFKKLPDLEGYRVFYENLFRQYTVIFLGFSGNDQNLLDIVSREVEGYAGYSGVESFFFLPHGTAVPNALNASPHLHAVHYSTDKNHLQLEEFLEQINARWSAQDLIAVVSDEEYRDADPSVDGEGISIFDLMIPAFKEGVDLTVVSNLKLFMVQTGIASSGRDRHPRSVANIVAQKFGLSVDHSKRLVDEHSHLLTGPVATTAGAAPPDFVTVLARGALRRAHAFDPDFASPLDAIKPAIRSTLESALKAYGANLALSLLQSERPSRLQLSDTVRNTLRAGHWPSVGPHDKDVLTLAVADLFMEPSEDEANVLSKLSVTSVAFGLIQAFPDTNLSDAALPTKVYLDATCVLPAIANHAPRSTALMQLISELRGLRRPVQFLGGFLNEVKAHFDGAKRAIQEHGLVKISDVRAFLSASNDIEEFANVFLLALSKIDCEGSEKALDTLRLHYDPDAFPQLIERLGIKVVHADANPAELSALKTLILGQKKQSYGRSLAAREILAKHEAAQLLVMQKELANGEKPWFATDDAQLRRIARGTEGLDRLTLLPVSGVSSLVRAMSNASEYSTLYPRLLWNPDWSDRADAIVAKALRDMLAKIDKGVRLPISDARDLAVKELMRRGDGADDTVPVYESVYAFLGKAIMQMKGDTPSRR